MNFAKHKTNAKKKQQAAKANSTVTEVPKVHSQYNLAGNGAINSSVYQNNNNNITKNGKANGTGLHKASIVSQQTVMYDLTGKKKELKDEPSVSEVPQPTSIGDIPELETLKVHQK